MICRVALNSHPWHYENCTERPGPKTRRTASHQGRCVHEDRSTAHGLRLSVVLSGPDIAIAGQKATHIDQSATTAPSQTSNASPMLPPGFSLRATCLVVVSPSAVSGAKGDTLTSLVSLAGTTSSVCASFSVEKKPNLNMGTVLQSGEY